MPDHPEVITGGYQYVKDSKKKGKSKTESGIMAGQNYHAGNKRLSLLSVISCYYWWS
jgi:hypothetical protein